MVGFNVHPCCGNDSQIRVGVKVIAIFDMVINALVVGILMLIIGLGIGSVLGKWLLSIPDPTGAGNGYCGVYFLGLMILYFMFKCYMSYQLWQGAKKDNSSKCRMWRAVNLIELIVGWVLLVGVCIAFAVMCKSANGRWIPTPSGMYNVTVDYAGIIWALVIGSSFESILRGYFIWVVSTFIAITSRLDAKRIKCQYATEKGPLDDLKS